MPDAKTPSQSQAADSPIEPTVGRVVLYNPGSSSSNKGQPYPALITHVFSRNCVNLSVQDDGSFHLKPEDLTPTSVMFSPDGTPMRTWTWMPFQKSQAARTDNADTKLELAIGILASHVDDETKAQIAELFN